MFENFVAEIEQKLEKNTDWKELNSGWIDRIRRSISTITDNKKLFHEFAPLYLYMNYTQAQKGNIFNLRYRGHSVANILVEDGEVYVLIDGLHEERVNFYDQQLNEPTALIERCHKRGFSQGGSIIIGWRSKEGAIFRRCFRALDKQEKKLIAKKKEASLESLLITEFFKDDYDEKKLPYIQPVAFAKKSRFQLKTPLSASGNVDIAGRRGSGGGVDILCRVGRGGGTKLCVVELKDENVNRESPREVVKQGIAYGIFLLKLLRSESGADWYKLFMSEKAVLPKKKLTIFVAVAMPDIKDDETDFVGESVNVGEDEIILHKISITTDNTQTEIQKIEASFYKPKA